MIKHLLKLTAIFICIIIYFRPKKDHERKSDPLEILRRSSLATRAGPNQRLKSVFGIHNAFTITEPTEHSRIMGEIRPMLKKIEVGDWSKPVDFMVKCLTDQMGKLTDERPINLSSMVRKLTFQLTLFLFFPREIPRPSDEVIEDITTSINSLWISSKCLEDESVAKNIDAEKKNLLLQIGRILDTNVEEGKNNPLNIIIPVYETLWRVVLRCFLEIRFRVPFQQQQTYRKTVLNFYRKPNFTNLEKETPDCPSLAAINKEALRLYPPTKRIYRLIDGETERVDVESLQRNLSIWGDDALEFKPSRWKFVEKKQLENYLPFGVGKFKCPAQGGVAPMMIAVLISVLIFKIRIGYTISEELEGPLSGERDAFKDLELMLEK